MMKNWYIYILKLSDDSFYTGITVDINRRLELHESGKGSKYVRSRLPIKDVIHIESVSSSTEALKREQEIKNMTRNEKEELVVAQMNTKEEKSFTPRVEELTQILYEYVEHVSSQQAVQHSETIKEFLKTFLQRTWDEAYNLGQNDATTFSRAMESHLRNHE